ncbi:MAG: hypothetical protein RJQ14_18755 [Marinoscillum sp.]
MISISFKEFFETLRPTTDLVKLCVVPEPLRVDLNDFLFGKTVVMRDGEVAIYPQDYNEWWSKLQNQGLDYDLKLI